MVAITGVFFGCEFFSVVKIPLLVVLISLCGGLYELSFIGFSGFSFLAVASCT